MNVWPGMSAGFFFGLFFLARCMLASGVGLFFFFLSVAVIHLSSRR